jgi:hypothetical protein
MCLAALTGHVSHPVARLAALKPSRLCAHITRQWEVHQIAVDFYWHALQRVRLVEFAAPPLAALEEFGAMPYVIH